MIRKSECNEGDVLLHKDGSFVVVTNETFTDDISFDYINVIPGDTQNLNTICVLTKFKYMPKWCNNQEIEIVKEFHEMYMQIRNMYRIAYGGNDPSGDTLESHMENIDYYTQFAANKENK